MLNENDPGKSVETLGFHSLRNLLAGIFFRGRTAKVFTDARNEIEIQQIEALKKSYKDSCKAWRKFDVVTGEEMYGYSLLSNKPVQWEAIESHLTAEILAAARVLQEPVLIAIPPFPFHFAVAALNNMAPPRNCWPSKMYGMKAPAEITFDLNRLYKPSHKLWDAAGSYYGLAHDRWRVAIVEGAKNLLPVENRGPRANGNVTLASRELRKKGLFTIDNLQIYISLLVMSLVEGDPIDTKGCTLLNSDTSFELAEYALAKFQKDHAVFFSASSVTSTDRDSQSWHLRGMIRIPLKSNQ